MPQETPAEQHRALAAELRSGPGAAILEELELAEAETEIGRLRRRDLSGALEEAMHRGDRVSAITRSGACVGEVDYVGKDYATVVTADTTVDIRSDRCAFRVHRAASGGHSVTGGSRTFKARLAEYAATGEIVTLIAPDLPVVLRGQVTVVAVDHVVLDDDTSTTVPIGMIDMIVRSR